MAKRKIEFFEANVLSNATKRRVELANMAQTGSIKKFYENKGYGFVVPDDGSEDVFVHVKDNPELKGAQPGDQVAFDSEWDDRKSKHNGTNLTFMKDQGNAESVGQQSAQDAEWGSDAAQDQGNAEGWERGPTTRANGLTMQAACMQTVGTMKLGRMREMNGGLSRTKRGRTKLEQPEQL